MCAWLHVIGLINQGPNSASIHPSIHPVLQSGRNLVSRGQKPWSINIYQPGIAYSYMALSSGWHRWICIFLPNVEKGSQEEPIQWSVMVIIAHNSTAPQLSDWYSEKPPFLFQPPAQQRIHLLSPLLVLLTLVFSSLDGSGEEWIAGQDFSRFARGLLASPAAARDLPLLKSTCSQKGKIQIRCRWRDWHSSKKVQRPMRRLTWVLPKPKNGNRVKHHHGETWWTWWNTTVVKTLHNLHLMLSNHPSLLCQHIHGAGK